MMDELRRLAADRDEAAAAWWFFLWAQLPNAVTPPPALLMPLHPPSCVASGLWTRP